MAQDRKSERTAWEEMACLRNHVARLERENATLHRLLADSALADINQELMARLGKLEKRLRKVEEEKRVSLQECEQTIANLYVTSYRLRATLDSAEMLEIIREVLVEMVGVEVFGVLLLDEKRKSLQLVAGKGVEDRLPSRSLFAGEGVVGEVTASGEPFFFEPKSPAEREAHLPLAAIPLNNDAQAVGVIVIYKLLSQKSRFSPTDLQLLELLATHAAAALVSSRLHDSTRRRLKTMEGFLQLMKPQ